MSLLSPPTWLACLALTSGYTLAASRLTWNRHLNDVAIRRLGFDPLGRNTVSGRTYRDGGTGGRGAGIKAGSTDPEALI